VASVVAPVRAWPTAILGEHVDLLTGFPFKSAEYTNDNDGVRLLRGDNVAQGYLRWDGAKLWPADLARDFSKFDLNRGDVILAMDRPWIEAGLKYAWVRAADTPALLVQRVARLRGKASLCTDYLRYVIGSAAFTEYVKSITTGTAVPHISGGDIAAFTFPLPPLPTQRKIAAILSAYDDLIANNTRRIAILEQMAQALYREWFVHFRFSGHEHARMVDSPLGSIPEGWRAVPVRDAVEIDPPTRVPREGEKPYVPMGSLSNGSMLIDEIEYRTGNSGSKFKNGDTLFARITPCLENGKTGYVQFLSTDDAVATGSTEFIVLRSRTLCPEYVYLLARTEEFRGNAIKSMTGASGRQRVQPTCFNKVSIAHPDLMTLDRFRQQVSPLFRFVQVLAERNDSLRRTRDPLLPKLVSGEVGVEGLQVSG